MVALQGQNMAEVLQGYMQQSEQINSHLILHSNSTHSTGLLLQQMPDTGGTAAASPTQQDPDAWPRLLALAQTLGQEEHLNTLPETLAQRLFWEEQPQVLATRLVQFECSCSRNKVATMLQSLGEDEVQASLLSSTAAQPVVQVDCHFCGAVYPFNGEQCAALFGGFKPSNKP
jgi:molecular chaperone Hsp33